jgi:hypothetical protein
LPWLLAPGTLSFLPSTLQGAPAFLMLYIQFIAFTAGTLLSFFWMLVNLGVPLPTQGLREKRSELGIHRGGRESLEEAE